MYFGEAPVFNVVQGIGLVPTMRENIKRDLSSDRVGQTIISKLLPEDVDELFTNSSFLSTTVTSILKLASQTFQRTRSYFSKSFLS